MRVLYFMLEPGWSIHLVHELELIEADLAEGAEVHVVPPGRALGFSDTFPHGDYGLRIDRDLLRLSYGLSLLSGPVTVHAFDPLLQASQKLPRLRQSWPGFKRHEDLDRFAFDGHDCGNAVLSSLISLTRDTAVDLSLHEDWVRRALDSSIKVYLAAEVALTRLRPDRVYVCNGRMASFRGVLRACEERGVDCRVHERGATLDRVGIWPNAMPHDVYAVQREIQRHWECSTLPAAEKQRVGVEFYRRRRAGKVFNWKVYTKGQRRHALPARARDAARVYSLFTSSEHERFALPQFYRYLLHASQLEGIVDVASVLASGGFDGVLCIRLHPNSRDERPDLRRALQDRVRQPFVEVVPPESVVDTYALLDASERVLTFGSTIAMEAAFWGKPSVSFATSPYANLDSIYLARDRKEMRRLLLDPLEPRRSEDTLKYGYYYQTFGMKLRHSRVRGLSSLTFRGRKIRSCEATGPFERARWRRNLRLNVSGDVWALPLP